MEVFRLSKEKYAHSLSGKGAAIQGGRWNSQGVEIIYSSANRSLAMAEIAVQVAYGNLPLNYMMITIHIPDTAPTQIIHSDVLNHDWNIFPEKRQTQLIGDKFIDENKALILKVPSAVTMGDYNYLINPRNKLFELVKIINVSPFTFDNRIFKAQK